MALIRAHHRPAVPASRGPEHLRGVDPDPGRPPPGPSVGVLGCRGPSEDLNIGKTRSSRDQRACLLKAQSNRGGVAIVVATTMNTAAAYVSAPTTGRSARTSRAPMPAKMRPTSPRGIMPSPTVSPEMPFGVTNAQASLPTIAAPVSSAAKATTRTSADPPACPFSRRRSGPAAR